MTARIIAATVLEALGILIISAGIGFVSFWGGIVAFGIGLAIFGIAIESGPLTRSNGVPPTPPK